RILEQVIEHGYGLDIIADKICSFKEYPKNATDKNTFQNVIEYLIDSGYYHGLYKILDHFKEYDIVSENRINSIQAKLMEINRDESNKYINEYGFLCYKY